MRKITALLIVVGIATVLTWGIWVYAATQVWSNEVTVEVGEGYTLTISDPADGSVSDTYTFTGTLNNNGVAVSGTTVTLYVDSGGGYSATGLTDVTDAMGGYSMIWAPTVSGSYSFKTLVTIS